MKKTNKKGFTIVELVIVIAVIAILAAVLIPTFSGVVEKAKKSTVLTSARNCLTEILAEANGDAKKIDTANFTTTISSDTGVTTIVIHPSTGDVTSIDFKTKDGTVTYTVGSATPWGEVSLTGGVDSYTAATRAS